MTEKEKNEIKSKIENLEKEMFSNIGKVDPNSIKKGFEEIGKLFGISVDDVKKKVKTEYDSLIKDLADVFEDKMPDACKKESEEPVSDGCGNEEPNEKFGTMFCDSRYTERNLDGQSFKVYRRRTRKDSEGFDTVMYNIISDEELVAVIKILFMEESLAKDCECDIDSVSFCFSSDCGAFKSESVVFSKGEGDIYRGYVPFEECEMYFDVDSLEILPFVPDDFELEDVLEDECSDIFEDESVEEFPENLHLSDRAESVFKEDDYQIELARISTVSGGNYIPNVASKLKAVSDSITNRGIRNTIASTVTMAISNNDFSFITSCDRNGKDVQKIIGIKITRWAYERCMRGNPEMLAFTNPWIGDVFPEKYYEDAIKDLLGFGEVYIDHDALSESILLKY